jgi:hypothetical protein
LQFEARLLRETQLRIERDGGEPDASVDEVSAYLEANGHSAENYAILKCSISHCGTHE